MPDWQMVEPTMAAGVAAALVLSAGGGFAAAAVARRFGILDRPAGRKAHATATPLLGGTALLAAWMLGLLPAGGPPGWVSGAVLAWLLGTADDIKPGGLSPRIKLGGQIVAASVGLAAGGAEGGGLVAGTVWLVFTMNAYNLLDNTDGLCMAAAWPPAVGLAVLAGSGWASANLGPALILAAGLTGLIPHNWPRARMFLGDGGSHFIGYVLGALTWGLVRDAGGFPDSLLAAAALFVLPVADVATVVVSRVRRRRPLWVGDRRHLSHRLLDRGCPEPVMLAILAGIAAAGALIAGVLMGIEG